MQADRFLSKVAKTSTCWFWRACKSSKGYGAFVVKGRALGAHRVAYEMFVGQIPDGLHVLHTCDNPSCVNPNHLWLGTNADNVADRSRKGRTQRHGRGGHRKLTADQARTIRELCARGIDQVDCALLFGVHKATVNDVVLGKTWR